MKAAQLRQAILQAAVQGKLVPQNLHDEPASILLERIASLKEKETTKKRGKKSTYGSLVGEEDTCYSLPDNWAWCRLADVVSSIDYGTSTKTHPTLDEIPILRMNNIQCGKLSFQDIKYAKKENVDLPFLYLNKGDILFNRTNSFELVGKSAVFLETEKKFSYASYLIRVRVREVEPRFINYYLNSEHCRKKQIEPNATQQNGQANFNGTKLASIFLPIPPIAEQLRIVAMLDKFMSLCDELEAAEKKLDALESNFAEYLPKSILQAAVQGKLVPQNLHDEPASELLKRIQTEKTRLIKEGKIKKEKPLPPITEDEIPYDLPDGWEWCRLNDVTSYIQRGKSPKYSEETKIPVLSQKCVQWNGVTLDKAKHIEPESLKKYDRERLLKNDDLLWNSTGHGTLGRVTIVNLPTNVWMEYPAIVADSHVTVIRPAYEFVVARYILAWLTSPEVQNDIVNKSSGSTNQIELATVTIKNHIIPLPPLAEQQRIATKVDELMALCEQLKNIDASTLPPAIDAQQRISPHASQPFVPVEPEERYGIAARGEISEKVSSAHRKARQSVFEDDDA